MRLRHCPRSVTLLCALALGLVLPVLGCSSSTPAADATDSGAPTDSGQVDSGPVADSGPIVDSGPAGDSGPAVDSGPVVDSGGVADTGSGGSTVLAGGLFHPLDLATDATSIYWSTQGNGINKIAIGGGAVTQIITDSDPKSIAVDATGVYWVTTAASPPSLMHAGLDGSSPSVVAGLDSFEGGRIFVVAGAVFFTAKIAGDKAIYSVAATGGTPKAVHSSLFIDKLSLADSTGIYWQETSPSPFGVALMHAELDGSSPATIALITGMQYLKGVSDDGTSVYYGVRDQSASTAISYLYKAPLPSGAPVKVLTFTGRMTDIAVDAKGMYFGDYGSTTAGVYQANADGTAKLLTAAPADASLTDPRFMRLDATHLFWFDGDDSGAARLRALTR